MLLPSGPDKVHGVLLRRTQTIHAEPSKGNFSRHHIIINLPHPVKTARRVPENAEITRAILAGEKGPKRDAVLLNAGAALYIAGKAPSFKEGVSLAAELIDSGAAMRVLERLIEVSNRPEAAS